MPAADLVGLTRRTTGPAIRGRERAELRALIAGHHEGALLIVGEDGAGKSSLLDSVGPVAGTVIRRLRASATESDIPLSGLSTIAAAFDAPTVEAFADRLLITRPDDLSAAALTAEFLSLIRESGAHPTLLLIDDANLLDELSRSVLAMMAHRLGGTGLRLVATATEPLGSALASMPRTNLRPLDHDEAAHFIRALTGRVADSAAHRIVTASAAGNVRAVADMTRLLSDDQLTRAAPIELPFRFPRRRDGHPAPANDLPTPNTLLALLSTSHLHSEEAVAVAGPGAEAAIEELVADGRVIHEGPYLRLSDPVARSTAYWSMSVAERRALHGEAAEAESTADPALEGWHRSWHDPERAQPVQLIEGATAFVNDGHVWQAVEFAERAITLGAGRPELASALLDLARALLLNGELAYAERYARHCSRSTHDASCAARVASLRAVIEFVATRRLATEHALSSLRASPGPDDAVMVFLTLAGIHLARWETDRGAELLAKARALLDQSSPEVIELHELTGMLRAALDGDEAPTLAKLDEVARQGGEAPSAVTLIALGRCLTFLDRENAARRMLRAAIDLEPRPAPLLVEHARYFLAELEIRAGNQFEAVRVIERAQASRHDTRENHPLMRPLLAWRSQVTGDAFRAAEEIRECHLRFGVDDPAISARLAASQGEFALAAGRIDDAIAHLRSAASIGSGFRNPSLLRIDVDMIEAYVLSGRREDALAQAREFFARSSGFHTPWTVTARARAEALITPGERSIPLFQRALGLTAPIDLTFPRARTLVNLAERLVEIGRPQEAEEHLLSARALFLHLGATAWVARTEMAKGVEAMPTASHPLLAALSPDEQRVVALVRQGKRNKEIAAELFVSLRTVEVRLTRIYQRMGVSSRAHLISVLADAGHADASPDAAERTS